MLLNHVAKQDERIMELTNKHNDFQARSMRKNLIVSGIPEGGVQENCSELAQKFFRNELGIERDIPIKIAHRIGMGKNRPVVVKLADYNDKGFIFQHTQRLKGSSYYVSEQLPEELAENKKQVLRLKGQNKKKAPAQQLNMNVKKDKLFVNNELYKLAVVPPTALSWLQKSEEEQKEIRKFQVFKGDTNNETQSSFVSYAARVGSIEEVRTAYNRVFLKEPRATHIVCAYILPGENFPMMQGAIDDREFGAARQILRMMQDQNCSEVAVFVAHYYGGQHLGPDRFRIYKELAATALNKLEQSSFRRLDVNQLLGQVAQANLETANYVFKPPAPPTLSSKFRPLPLDPISNRLKRLASEGNSSQEEDHSWETLPEPEIEEWTTTQTATTELQSAA